MRAAEVVNASERSKLQDGRELKRRPAAGPHPPCCAGPHQCGYRCAAIALPLPMFASRQAGSGRRPALLALAAAARVLLALLAALQLSAGLPTRPDGDRQLLAAGARGSQLQPPPLVRRDLLSSLPPPRRLQRRPSRQWWESLQPLWADEFDGSTLDESKWEYMDGDGSQFGIPGAPHNGGLREKAWPLAAQDELVPGVPCPMHPQPSLRPPLHGARAGWGNKELQNYTRRWTNVRVMNGNLVLQAQVGSRGAWVSCSQLFVSLAQSALLHPSCLPALLPLAGRAAGQPLRAVHERPPAHCRPLCHRAVAHLPLDPVGGAHQAGGRWAGHGRGRDMAGTTRGRDMAGTNNARSHSLPCLLLPVHCLPHVVVICPARLPRPSHASLPSR